MIRQATMDDIGEILVMLDAMRKESNYNGIKLNDQKAINYINGLIKDNKYVAVIEHLGCIVGAMLGDIQRPWYSDDKIGHDYGIYVKPEHRGRKESIGLVTNFIGWCKANGCKQVRPGITTGDESIARLYKSLGFEQSGFNFLMEI